MNAARELIECHFSIPAFLLPPSSFPLLDLVVIDGFTDFTRTQHEIIELLAGRAETAIITLPLEPEPRRTDLFAKPLRTLAELRRRHPELRVEEIPRPAAAQWPAMAHLEQMLFVNPRRQRRGKGDRGTGVGNGGIANSHSPIPNPNPCPSVSGIEILAAARQVGEIELIAARSNGCWSMARRGRERSRWFPLAARGRRAGERGLRPAGHSRGVRVGQALDRSPALRAWPRWCNWISTIGRSAGCWPCWAATTFSPTGPSGTSGRAAADVERTIRKLQIPRGRRRLIEQLAGKGKGGLAVRSRVARPPSGSACHPGRGPRLAQVLDALPERATLPDWGNAWQRLAQETGLQRAMDTGRGKGEGEGGRGGSGEFPFPRPGFPLSIRSSCLGSVEGGVAAGDTLAGWLARRPPELDRRAAFEALLDILRSERVGHAGDESGCVRVLWAASVRSLRIPYRFLAGLSEKVFPPADREDRLYSEAEYVRPIEAGLPLVARMERNRQEMLLFYEAITRATERLYLSYPALDESPSRCCPARFCEKSSRFLGQIGFRGHRADRPKPHPAG